MQKTRPTSLALLTVTGMAASVALLAAATFASGPTSPATCRVVHENPDESLRRIELAVDGQGRVAVVVDAAPNRRGAPNESYVRLLRLGPNLQPLHPAVVLARSETQRLNDVRVDAAPNGSSAVLWRVRSPAEDPPSTLFRVQLYSENGQALGEPIDLELGSPRTHSLVGPASIHMVDEGGFWLVWSRTVDAARSREIFARRFAADGEPAGEELWLDLGAPRHALVGTYRSATVDTTGRLIVTAMVSGTSWQSTTRWMIGRVFQPNGQPDGPPVELTDKRWKSYTHAWGWNGADEWLFLIKPRWGSPDVAQLGASERSRPELRPGTDRSPRRRRYRAAQQLLEPRGGRCRGVAARHGGALE